MKRVFYLLSGVIILTIINSCAVTEKANREIKLSVQAGINHGGITENTDFSMIDVPNSSEVDAYTGATKIGANVGIHVSKPLAYGEIGSGLDYMLNSQTFKYNAPSAGYLGTRDLSVSQFMLPLTYHFNILNSTFPNSDVQIKLGYLAQLNMVLVNNHGTLPEYSINNYSGGAVFGFSFYPFHIGDKQKIGFYVDVYKGSQIYEDYYNQTAFEMPGSSFFKAGIKFRFK